MDRHRPILRLSKKKKVQTVVGALQEAKVPVRCTAGVSSVS